MAMDINSTEIQKSERNLKIVFNIMSPYHCYDIRESDIFEIGHFALVRFKFSRKKNPDFEICSSVSYKIHESQKDANVQITVTCKVGDKTIVRSTCSHDWSEFIDICNNKKVGCMPDYWIFCIKANISMNIMKPGPCQFLYQDDNYTDFQLVSDDSSVSSVPVHRVVMAGHSEVFKTMLSGEWKETAKGCLEVKGVTQETLQHLKDYMYLGSLPEHEDLRPLLLVAKCYMMRHLEEACADKLAQTATSENFQGVLEFAVDNRLFGLISSIVKNTSTAVVEASEAINKELKLKAVEE